MIRPVARALAAVAVTVALLFAFVATADGGPANPTPFELVQPDGARFLVRLVGDEWSNAHQTLDGYAVVRNDSTGYWVYADKGADGALVATALIVTRDQPGTLPRGLRPDPTASFDAGAASVSPSAVVGNRPVLLILVQFTNRAAMTTAAAWQSRFFGPTSSVAHHYTVSSYGNSTALAAAEVHGTANDGIVGWLTLPTTHPNTASAIDTRNQQLTRDAILAADPFVNFSAYDSNADNTLTPAELSIVVIAAGNETSFGGANACSPSVWGHVWSIQSPLTAPVVDGKRIIQYGQFGEMHCGVSSPPGQIATIGIMAHELGHLYGLPDLYDGDQSSEGVGNWSLMGGGSWNSTVRSGDSPALMDPWSKARLGWVNPTLVSGTLANQSIPASATSAVVYQFRAGNAQTGTGEYFLLENRQRTSYDTALPGAGLLIWHIDESRPNNQSECSPGGLLGLPACSATVHYKVAVVQADHQFHLERASNRGDGGDPYPGTSLNRAFTPASAPTSHLWNGSASGISVTAIGNSAMVMTATLSDGTVSSSFTLSLTIRGSGNGLVMMSPGSIACTTGTCLNDFAANTSVTLSAVPAAGATLKVWSGACAGVLPTCTVSMTQATSVAATFAAVFSDSPLAAGTFIKVAHILELRTAVNILRGRYGLSPVVWSEPSLAAGSPVRAAHFTELRTALLDIYTAAKMTPPAFSDTPLVPGVTPIRTAHLTELRAAVAGLE